MRDNGSVQNSVVAGNSLLSALFSPDVLSGGFFTPHFDTRQVLIKNVHWQHTIKVEPPSSEIL